MQSSSADRDFAPYNAAQEGRDVRPLARAAVDAARPAGDAAGPMITGRSTDTAGSTDAAGTRRVAIDLGCGRGIETRHLAESGYSVHAYDVDPSVAPAIAELAAELPVQHETLDLASITALPATDLILSCATLPFVPREHFHGLWQAMREALRAGGVLAVDLFGDRDDWAGTDGTFMARAEVETLLAGFDVLSLQERERDGASFQGPKHWHTFQVLARLRSSRG
ncbi:class I SAM-dependent methyltransferase [Brachybacterium tyrofermentans]|uniref:class I SAM-dependent methyltransferase n=1 Tax=Brachybacterium tyrofermentans TaxID=47848 RepID=UPI003FD55954